MDSLRRTRINTNLHREKIKVDFLKKISRGVATLLGRCARDKGRDMGDNKWPLCDPRVAGAREHYERIKMFLQLGEKSTNAVERFRFLIAGIHFSRAIIEIMLDAAQKGLLKLTYHQLDEELHDKVPWYDIIERIRIHDFHRFGLMPPNPEVKELFQRGPMKLKARKGAARYSILPTGPQKQCTGASSVDEQRPLLITDGKFFDDESQRYVTLEEILKNFVGKIPAVIKEFESKLGNNKMTE
jgi:hypothetical protein